MKKSIVRNILSAPKVSTAINLLLSLTITLGLASQAFSMTLLEALEVSLENNPKILANTERLKAGDDRLEAARLGWLPVVRVGVGSTLTQGKDNQMSQSASVGISTNIPIFDGGTRKHNLTATINESEVTKERYNSTSRFIKNTRGSIANAVLDTYVGVLSITEAMKYNKSSQNTLNIFLKAAKSEDEKANILQQIERLKTESITLNFNLKQLAKNFKYYSTVDLPALEKLQSFTEAINSLVIPKDAETAFNIALEKNPDIRAAEKSILVAEARYNVVKAQQGPQVSASFSVGQNGYKQGSGEFDSSPSKSVSLNFSMSFDAANKHSKSASLRNLVASRYDRDGEIEETKNSLENIYPQLENHVELYKRYLDGMNASKIKLEAVLTKIKNGEPFSMKDEALFNYQSYNGYAIQITVKQTEILITRFSIQQTMGTLFDILSDKAGRSNLNYKFE